MIESAGNLRQVKYWDNVVKCWVDYGDPVPASEASEKALRCRMGFKP